MPASAIVSSCRSLGIDSDKVPAHVAVIMDGNGRWAKSRFLPRQFGHRAGAEALRATIKACVEFGVHYLSVYTFSTENWKRPEAEVGFLMGLFQELIKKEIAELNRRGVRLHVLGATEELDPGLQDKIREAESLTAKNDTLHLNLMMNYGARRELVDAVRAIVKNPPETITEATISDMLTTKQMPDPDILIRTGGDFRVSNFMLWQIAYAEIFVLPILWPEFGRTQLAEIIKAYQTRDRRFGGLNA